MKNQAMSFRFTPEAKIFISALSKHLGISQASVIEIAVRDLARRNGLEIKATEG